MLLAACLCSAILLAPSEHWDWCIHPWWLLRFSVVGSMALSIIRSADQINWRHEMLEMFWARWVVWICVIVAREKCTLRFNSSPPDVALKIGQMTQALKLPHELCREEMPSSDCSYLKRIWLVLGLGEYGFRLVLKTSLSRGGAFMEEQMLLPLPVENLHTQVVLKMSSFFFFFTAFGCCTVTRFRGTILHFFGIGNSTVVFPFAANMPMGMYNHPFALFLGTVTVPLLLKWFCGKWSVELKMRSSICFKSWILWACLICRADV